ncbi:MAG: hypothetical protein RH949_29465 [Coleofasciculus sp. A1-SPW-01]|uniref:hypothetical protein n=1 Tax=Coleofasciculus TaxID=669368 RepID=UPI0002FFA66F|nr:hypothetical protein [Coleofasciculus chthonoplastes]
MKPTIQNVDLLLGIQPTEVAKYLQSHGWQKQSQIKEKASIWTLPANSEPEFEIVLPLKPEIPGFALRLYEVVQTLELVENRSYFQILGDLVTQATNIHVQGIITQLDKFGEAERVILMGCAVGKFRKIKFDLTAADYPFAVKAYQERLPVVCTGDLVKANELFVLKNIRNFALDESWKN